MKYIIDPVHGFTAIEPGLTATLVKHPLFQRLTRIRQLGVEGVVYPGAQHTRFQHSLGAYHLTRQAAAVLETKGFTLDAHERESLLAAILLHDVGHGPFSHVLEEVIVPGVSHEHISRLVMERINAETGGALTDAIRIFTGSHERQYLHELVSSQLDMDRLDYLCRDSFFTGVREGNVGAARIIQMMAVVDGHVAFEEKGIYSIENYLMTRRMMYWQVYYHKTAIAAEVMLTGALRRARELMRVGRSLFASPALAYFLRNEVGREDFDGNPGCLDRYMELDDNDIISALKVWQHDADRTLAALSGGFINRRLFKTEIYDGPAPEGTLRRLRTQIAAARGISPEEAHYFAAEKTIAKDMYSMQADQIRILMRDGSTTTLPEVSEIIRADTAAAPYRKTYLIHTRN